MRCCVKERLCNPTVPARGPVSIVPGPRNKEPASQVRTMRVAPTERVEAHARGVRTARVRRLTECAIMRPGEAKHPRLAGPSPGPNHHLPRSRGEAETRYAFPHQAKVHTVPPSGVRVPQGAFA